MAERGDRMFAENDRISVRQIQCIIMLNILSFGFFVFPSVFQDFSGLEIIISSAIGGFAGILLSKTVIYVCSGQAKGLGDVFDRYTGKKAGFILRLLFMLYLLLKGSAIVFMYSSVIKTNSLPKTPVTALITVALIISVYIATRGIETIGRISEIFIVLILAGILFVFVFAAKSGGFSNISPGGGIGVKDITIRGIKSLYFFQGMEILYILSMFSGDKSAIKKKDIFGAFALVWLIMTFSAFLIFTKLKVIEEDFISVWPFIKVADSIEIPFAFIERQDFIIIALTTTFMVFGVALSIFASGVILSDITKKFGNTKLYSYFALAGVITALIIKALFGLNVLWTMETFIGVFCFIALPLILADFKKRKEAKCEK